jgi:hypothetical protein
VTLTEKVLISSLPIYTRYNINIDKFRDLCRSPRNLNLQVNVPGTHLGSKKGKLINNFCVETPVAERGNFKAE